MASVRRACQVAAAPFLLLQGPEEGRCHPGQGSPPFWAEPGPPVAAHLRSISGEQASEWWSVDVLSSVPAGRGGAAWAGAGPWVGGAVGRGRGALSRAVPAQARTQGPGLLAARAQAAGVLEATEDWVLLLLRGICREAGARWAGSGGPAPPPRRPAVRYPASSCRS